MEKVYLTRAARNPVGSYGVLVYNSYPLCVTAERPWLNNKPNVSCIPAGTYHFKRYQSPHNGETWITQDVPGRSNIEIHAANTPEQVEGCCAVGLYFAQFDGVMGVTASLATMNRLRATLPNEFDLVVTDAPA